MSTFESQTAYSDFARIVRYHRRWAFDGKEAEFLAAVRAACKSRSYNLKSGWRLYRAQIGSKLVSRPPNDDEVDCGIEEEQPFPAERMIPDPKLANKPGRANPQGFTYLYLADTPETALAEMRPWVAESLSLALFETKRELRLVVCKAGAAEVIFDENPSAEKLDKHVWNDISTAFARPVSQDDRESSYIPTQILAEVFKAEGFDGIVYRSGLERGSNVVLFDPTAARPIHRYAYTLKKVRYDFEAVPNYMICCQDKEGKLQQIWEIHTESPG
jgi:RES domain-containing protein